MDYCLDTYNDALSWPQDRIEREITALVHFMRDHWCTMSERNKQVILREYRALRAVQTQR